MVLKLEDFKEASNISAALIDAVVEQLGGWDEEYALSDFRNIAGHGIDGGYSGFIYYAETVKFWVDNKSEILAHLNEYYDQLGYESVIGMVQSFNCLGKDYSHDEIGKVLYSEVDPFEMEDGVRIANALAWYAGEEVARSYVDFEDEQQQGN